MKNKQIIVLVAVTVVICLVAFIFGPVESRKPTKPDKYGRLFEELSVSGVTEIVITRTVESEAAKELAKQSRSLHVESKNEKSLLLSRKAETGWVVVSDNIQYPADQEKVAQLLDTIQVLERDEVISSDSADYSLYEVDRKRGVSITLKNARGQIIADLIVGKPSRDGFFVRSVDSSDILLIQKLPDLPGYEDRRKKSALKVLDASPKTIEWLDKNFANFKPQNIKWIELVLPGGGKARFTKMEKWDEKTKRNRVEWEMADLPKGQMLKKWAVANLARSFQNMKIEDLAVTSNFRMQSNEFLAKLKDSIAGKMRPGEITSEALQQGRFAAAVNLEMDNGIKTSFVVRKIQGQKGKPEDNKSLLLAWSDIDVALQKERNTIDMELRRLSLKFKYVVVVQERVLKNFEKRIAEFFEPVRDASPPKPKPAPTAKKKK